MFCKEVERQPAHRATMPRLAPLKSSPRVVPGAAGSPELTATELIMPRGFSPPLALEVEAAQPTKSTKTSFVVRASPSVRSEPVVAALGLKEDCEISVDEVMRCAKVHAELELRKVHEGRRVSAIIRAGEADGSIDAKLRKQLETLDEDGDGEISNEEVVHFCKHFANHQLVFAEEHAAREAAEEEARQLRSRLVGRFGLILAALDCGRRPRSNAGDAKRKRARSRTSRRYRGDVVARRQARRLRESDGTGR